MNFEELCQSLPTYRKAWHEEEITEAALRSKVHNMMCNGYVFTPKTLEALHAYMQGYSVLLSGGVGTGKTFFFKCADKNIEILDMNVCFLWDYRKLDEWLFENRFNDILVDDIGAGNAGNNYGVKYDTLMVILESRLGCDARTNMTTNLSNDRLIEAFDYRIVDRIYEMCRPFVMDRTESMRVPKPIRAKMISNH